MTEDERQKRPPIDGLADNTCRRDSSAASAPAAIGTANPVVPRPAPASPVWAAGDRRHDRAGVLRQHVEAPRLLGLRTRRNGQRSQQASHCSRGDCELFHHILPSLLCRDSRMNAKLDADDSDFGAAEKSCVSRLVAMTPSRSLISRSVETSRFAASLRNKTTRSWSISTRGRARRFHSSLKAHYANRRSPPGSSAHLTLGPASTGF